jgi:hypothetical protein
VFPVFSRAWEFCTLLTNWNFFFFTFFSTSILQKYMVRKKFCKTIHLSTCPTAVGGAQYRTTAVGVLFSFQKFVFFLFELRWR